MKRIAVFVLLCFFFVVFAKSQTDIPSGSVSGKWNKSDSPYRINGDIQIDKDSALSIEPGVKVEFQGHYKLKVYGQLLAEGALGDSIVFTVKDTTGFGTDSIPDGGWGGLRFEGNNKLDTSRIKYCKIHYGKVMYPDSCGGGIFVKDYLKLIIAHSNISYNTIFGKYLNYDESFGGGLYIVNSSLKFKNNYISNNKILKQYKTIFNKYNNKSFGGGIYAYNSNLDIINCIVVNNIIKGDFAYGGGVCAVLSNINFIHNNISNNYCYSSGTDIEVSSGGGIYLELSTSSVLNNKISKNYSLSLHGWCNYFYHQPSASGGGIACINSKINLENNEIICNTISGFSSSDWASDAAGGGIYIYGNKNNCNIIIKSNKVCKNISQGGKSTGHERSGGSAFGAGIYVNAKNTSVANNLIDSNNSIGGRPYDIGTGAAYGGGLYLSGDIYINNNIISNNRCISNRYCEDCSFDYDAYAFGGGIYSIGKSVIINNIIVNNILSAGINYDYEDTYLAFGAGIFCENSNIINNTIFNNFYAFDSWNLLDTYYKTFGRSICADSITKIENSIIWHNQTINHPQIYNGIVSYCDVIEGYDGINNINKNPNFDTISDSSYSLLFNSPCIDKGNPDTTGLLLPEYDIAGNKRFINGRVDIGAYEFQLTKTISGTISYDNSSHTPLQNTKTFLLDGKKQKLDSVLTDAYGHFSFNNVIKGDYYVTSLIDKPWGGGDPGDALFINRNYLGMYSFKDNLLKTAAEIDGNNSIDPGDALFVNRRYIGLTDKFSNDWTTDPPVIINFDGEYLDYNIKTVCTGDVDASYSF